MISLVYFINYPQRILEEDEEIEHEILDMQFYKQRQQTSMGGAGTLPSLAIPKASIPAEFVLGQVPAKLNVHSGLPAESVHRDSYVS